MHDSVTDRLRRVVHSRTTTEAAARESGFLEASKQRLLTILKKKLTTGFIGAIARFEEHIGRELWGHGKPESECTKEQLAWRAVWDDCRTEVLNNGNSQIRAIESEMGQYDVKWQRYRNVLPVRPRQA
jgi:hypothetical protein